MGRTFEKSMLITIPGLFLGFFLGIAKGLFDYRIRNIGIYQAAGYIILFTSIIFIAKMISKVAKRLVSPLERN